MKTRILGTDLKVSAVGYGCMGLTHAYGPAAEKSEAIRLIRQASDMGYARMGDCTLHRSYCSNRSYRAGYGR